MTANSGSKIERNGALHIVVGAVILVFGLAAAGTPESPPLWNASLIVGALAFIVYGIVKALRFHEPAKPSPDAEHSHTS
jgi:cytosine/uracil/thiamine/allantoin permease